MAKRGRPSSYKKEYAEQAYKLCLLTATDEELADFFGVQVSTLNNWKLKHPEFMEALKRGKTIADAEVGSRLHERAMGYYHPEVKVFMHEGKPIEHEVLRHYPPETAACIFWLKNRQRTKWRDKQDVGHEGPDGGPIIFKMGIPPRED